MGEKLGILLNYQMMMNKMTMKVYQQLQMNYYHHLNTHNSHWHHLQDQHQGMEAHQTTANLLIDTVLQDYYSWHLNFHEHCHVAKFGPDYWFPFHPTVFGHVLQVPMQTYY